MEGINMGNMVNDSKINLDQMNLKISKDGRIKSCASLDQSKNKIAFLLGGAQIKGSVSPFMHNHFARKYGLNLNYLLNDLTKLDISVAQLFTLMQADKNVLGANITMPYKTDIFNILSDSGRMDNGALLSKSVNTLFKDEDGLFAGMNTDIIGFTESLRENIDISKIDEIIILGGGGSARAICIGALMLGIKNISLFNRSVDKVSGFLDSLRGNPNLRLIKSFGPKDSVSMNARPLDELSRIVFQKNTLIVNTLPFGFNKDLPDLPIEKTVLEMNLDKIICVFDIVYSLSELNTPLIRLVDAMSDGKIKTIGGINMLIHQAKGGFDRWTSSTKFDCKEMKEILNV